MIDLEIIPPGTKVVVDDHSDGFTANIEAVHISRGMQIEYTIGLWSEGSYVTGDIPAEFITATNPKDRMPIGLKA